MPGRNPKPSRRLIHFGRQTAREVKPFAFCPPFLWRREGSGRAHRWSEGAIHNEQLRASVKRRDVLQVLYIAVSQPG